MVRRFLLQETRSAVTDVVELFAVGGLASTVASLLILANAEWTGVFVRMADLVQPNVLVQQPWRILASVLTVLGVSVLLCVGAGWLVGRLSRQRLSSVREGSTWTRALVRSNNKKRPYLAVELTDGRLVEGFVLSVSTSDDPANKVLVLQGPLAVRGQGEPRERSAADFVVVPGNIIGLIHGSYVDVDDLKPRPAEA
jgi:hypothetical protein